MFVVVCRCLLVGTVVYYCFVVCWWLLFVAVLAIATYALQDTDLIVNDDLINSINNGHNPWVAGRNERFEGVTVAEGIEEYNESGNRRILVLYYIIEFCAKLGS